MKKSVYSLVLMDNVVEEVDRLAYAMNTNRSNMINQILAEYLSMTTPEKRMREIFDCAQGLLHQQDAMQILVQPSDAVLALRSALRYKYNPTVRYAVELYRSSGPRIGELKVSLRTQNATLISYLEQFFSLWARLEQVYIPQRVRAGGTCALAPGRMTRILMAPPQAETMKNDDWGRAIAQYVSCMDDTMKLFFAGVDGDPQQTLRRVEKRYADALAQGKLLL